MVDSAVNGYVYGNFYAMCSLKFEYHNRYQTGEEPIEIPEDAKAEFEDRAYDMWASICEELNRTEGYIKGFLSKNGLYVESGQVMAVDWLTDYCVANDIPNAFKITKVYLDPPPFDNFE
ncbi:hypothetical protein [Mucilaginibacter sp.]|uniref:hypothetical protein n=1 Tax=Mucilaginibacter sp. TaxID=1882438 RepID=UPI003263A50F